MGYPESVGTVDRCKTVMEQSFLQNADRLLSWTVTCLPDVEQSRRYEAYGLEPVKRG